MERERGREGERENMHVAQPYQYKNKVVNKNTS